MVMLKMSNRFFQKKKNTDESIFEIEYNSEITQLYENVEIAKPEIKMFLLNKINQLEEKDKIVKDKKLKSTTKNNYNIRETKRERRKKKKNERRGNNKNSNQDNNDG
eukprot:TRINITY_DN3138_c1_g1_i2.p1 TRINITY_DN3138_c1_g1~~TRINITY_DN3138_c1_g1_i2.p1  ORF type:complete len:107 (+),score=26.02 TRINITY_DN3138_c1_g1_i2:112-432(+)